MTRNNNAALADTIGVRLRRAREAAGLSLPDLAFEVWTRLPRRYHIVPETIRKYEGDSIKRQDLIVLATICEVLGLSLAELSPDLEDERRMVLDVMRSRCFSWNAA